MVQLTVNIIFGIKLLPDKAYEKRLEKKKQRLYVKAGFNEKILEAKRTEHKKIQNSYDALIDT